MTNITIDNNYWLERWSNQDTPFNQKEPNQFLVKHLEKIKYKAGDICFVPLCGSSIDMLYLQSKGFDIIGVELSEQAIIEFFKSNKIPFTKSQTVNNLDCYCSENIKILCGDIFNVQLNNFPRRPTLWYDRGGYVALPIKIRMKYAKKMIALCGNDTQILLNTTIHDGDTEQPPFSIQRQELTSLFKNKINFELIEHYEIPELPEEKILQGRSFQEYNIYLGNRKI
jgi:thiopurine S-methyltransferase